MARRIVTALLLLVGVWLFAPTSSSHPAIACSPTGVPPVTASPSPLSNFTPPPPTNTPAPLPPTIGPSPPPATPTFTPEQRLSQLIESSQVAVVGTIRTVNEEQVLLDVEAYTKTDKLTETLSITTYRQRFEIVGDDCDPEWSPMVGPEQIVSLRYQGKRAVFFLESYEAGHGEVVIGRDGAILYMYDGELYALDSAESFGPAAQLDSWLKPGAASVQPPPAVQTSRWQPWMWIPAALAAAGLALLTLGLILKRHRKT
jgi:hypothetical protein